MDTDKQQAERRLIKRTTVTEVYDEPCTPSATEPAPATAATQQLGEVGEHVPARPGATPHTTQVHVACECVPAADDDE